MARGIERAPGRTLYAKREAKARRLLAAVVREELEAAGSRAYEALHRTAGHPGCAELARREVLSRPPRATRRSR